MQRVRERLKGNVRERYETEGGDRKIERCV
jgi:hypothetical protein